MREIFYWDGPGWYASRQVGSYDDTRVETTKVGEDQHEEPDTYGSSGTPVWHYEPPEHEEIEIR